ncbi:hypothetical protein WN944_014215 [Citrus x changshan-huyou]|uniref:Uncharacterized protein n=1 Tax=Citrus x changshan-huyou TaxID=2935761 RepID=A0AAP0M5B8_9ROSI
MVNGSLEKWLCSHNYFLDILERLNIMTDVGPALEYLHHDHSSAPVMEKICDSNHDSGYNWLYGTRQEINLLMKTFTRSKPTNEMFTGEISLRDWLRESLPRALSDVVDANLVREEQAFSAKMNCLLGIMHSALDCCME